MPIIIIIIIVSIYNLCFRWQRRSGQPSSESSLTRTMTLSVSGQPRTGVGRIPWTKNRSPRTCPAREIRGVEGYTRRRLPSRCFDIYSKVCSEGVWEGPEADVLSIRDQRAFITRVSALLAHSRWYTYTNKKTKRKEHLIWKLII